MNIYCLGVYTYSLCVARKKMYEEFTSLCNCLILTYSMYNRGLHFMCSNTVDSLVFVSISVCGLDTSDIRSVYISRLFMFTILRSIAKLV